MCSKRENRVQSEIISNFELSVMLLCWMNPDELANTNFAGFVFLNVQLDESSILSQGWAFFFK